MRARANPFGRFLAAAVLSAAAWAAPHALAQEPVFGLKDGESLTYSVRWGVIPSVGKITITAERFGTGDDAKVKVTTTTATTGLARGIFAFDGRGESIYQARTGRLLSSSEWSAYRNKEVKNSIVFDYDKQTALFTDDIHPEKTRTIKLPAGNPSDLILALIGTRAWNLEKDLPRDSLVFFQDQIYPLTIHKDGTDYIVCPLGMFNTTVLMPKMEKSEPIGMFRHGSTVRVWIETDDNRRLPVRFEVGFRFGAGTATLIGYTPPK